MYAGVPSTLPAWVNWSSPPRRLTTTVPAATVASGSDGPPLAEHLGQPPVHHLHLAEATDHDVGGLEVAVDHPVRVGVRHRLARLLKHRHEPPPVVAGVGAVLEEVVERLPLDELHGHEQASVGEGAEVVDGGDRGVLELGRDAGLVGEPPGGRGRRAELVLEDLDGHLAAEDGVSGTVDDAHPAAGDLGEELVPAAGRRQRVRAGGTCRVRRGGRLVRVAGGPGRGGVGGRPAGPWEAAGVVGHEKPLVRVGVAPILSPA
jgi:hypothetical protein